MKIKLREILREDLGGTYSVGVSGAISLFPYEEYNIHISFGCSPDRVEEMTNTIFMQMDSLKTFGPEQKYIDKVRESQLRQYEKSLKENRFWLNTLNRYYFRKHDPLKILDFPQLVEQLDIASIQSTAQKFLNMDHYVRVVLYPENED
jgi:zinc protease